MSELRTATHSGAVSLPELEDNLRSIMAAGLCSHEPAILSSDPRIEDLSLVSDQGPVLHAPI
jgi:hypothetical protein